MQFIKQCKGKDLDKVAKSKLDEGTYLWSKKYDGNYVQIHKFGEHVTLYSSGGIRFEIEELTNYLVKNNRSVDFIIEAEYIGLTDGSLGSRNECTTTRFRTRTAKGLLNFAQDIKFMVFDCIYYHNLNLENDCKVITQKFSDRRQFFKSIEMGKQLEIVEFKLMTLAQAKIDAKYYIDWNFGEGLFGKKEHHMYIEGKRSNDAIKLKYYPKVEMICIGASLGEGKYSDVISSLRCVSSDDLIEVNVGGVIIGELRIADKNYFIGKRVLIEYESFSKTYVQPRVKALL